MSTYRDHAVVLRKVDYGEADRIFTLLTREHGKVGVIARGIRRTTSRLSAPLEVYAVVDVLLARGKNLDIVTQAELTDMPRVLADPERTACAAVITEVADRISEDRTPLSGLYELVVAALRVLAAESEPRRATAWFVNRALEATGYAPVLDACARCSSSLAEAPAQFSPEAGGLLCSRCGDPAAPAIPVAAIKILRVLAAGDLDLFRRLRLSTAILVEVEDALCGQLEYHLDRQLNSLRFLRQMRSN